MVSSLRMPDVLLSIYAPCIFVAANRLRCWFAVWLIAYQVLRKKSQRQCQRQQQLHAYITHIDGTKSTRKKYTNTKWMMKWTKTTSTTTTTATKIRTLNEICIWLGVDRNASVFTCGLVARMGVIIWFFFGLGSRAAATQMHRKTKNKNYFHLMALKHRAHKL